MNCAHVSRFVCIRVYSNQINKRVSLLAFLKNIVTKRQYVMEHWQVTSKNNRAPFQCSKYLPPWHLQHMLCCESEVSIFTRSEDRKGQTKFTNWTAWGSYGSLKLIENGTIWQITYEFSSNYVPFVRYIEILVEKYSYRFFRLHVDIWRSRLGWPCWNFTTKLESLGYDMALITWWSVLSF